MNRGRCLCGAVQFEAGSLDTMVHCHCSMCRRHHGAMFATFLTAPTDGFGWLAGAEQVSTYASSERGLRPFCRICGSVAPAVLPDCPGIAFVPAGNLESDPGRRPTLHMFAASRASWFPITDSLPQHATFPPEFGGGTTVENPPPAETPGTIRGRCLCGDVGWELAGDPERVMNCHCSRCRRARSAAHATNAFFRREQLAWRRGEDRIRSYSLPGARRFGQDFCARCGSPVPRVVPSTGYVVVPCGGLDGAPGRGPEGHVFAKDKAPWFEITDALPRFDAHAP